MRWSSRLRKRGEEPVVVSWLTMQLPSVQTLCASSQALCVIAFPIARVFVSNKQYRIFVPNRPTLLQYNVVQMEGFSPDEGGLWLALRIAKVQDQREVAVVDGNAGDINDARDALLGQS